MDHLLCPEEPICLHNGMLMRFTMPDLHTALRHHHHPFYLPYVQSGVPEVYTNTRKMLLAEEQPLHAATSPTAESPGYIPESDPEEDPEEDPADYPADRDDDDDEEEEEEHPALALCPHVHRYDPPDTINQTPNSPTQNEIPESCLPLRKRVRFASPTPSREARSSSSSSNDREREAKMARKAWGLSMDASNYARSDVMSLRTTVVAQSVLISELQLVDHRRQRDTVGEFLRSMDCKKVRHSLMHQERLVAVLRFGYVKMAPKRKTTRLNPDATLTPVTDTHTTTSVTNAQIQAMIKEGITAALAARDATRNGDDSHTSGTGARRPVQVSCECTYPDFLKCQPLNFKGTEGVVGLTQWFEKMESVYSISNYTVACQVKFATCTLQGNALTWWNSHVKTTTPEAAHAMPWRTLKKMMTDKYCPRGEIKKLEFKM
ncbi:putative reverse transcriptase domain-containing protein [Tanacetum coccineum]